MRAGTSFRARSQADTQRLARAVHDFWGPGANESSGEKIGHDVVRRACALSPRRGDGLRSGEANRGGFEFVDLGASRDDEGRAGGLTPSAPERARRAE